MVSFGAACRSALSGAHADGEVRIHFDEAVRTTIASVFTRSAETGSARRGGCGSDRRPSPTAADASGLGDPLGGGQLHRHPPGVEHVRMAKPRRLRHGKTRLWSAHKVGGAVREGSALLQGLGQAAATVAGA